MITAAMAQDTIADAPALYIVIPDREKIALPIMPPAIMVTQETRPIPFFFSIVATGVLYTPFLLSVFGPLENESQTILTVR